MKLSIIFPVASEAVAKDDSFGIVPGVSGGEGCSTAGGCATCPYMKMNSLEALFDVAEGIQQEIDLSAYHPKQYVEQLRGRSIASLGGEPISFMRYFQQHGVMSPDLITQVCS